MRKSKASAARPYGFESALDDRAAMIGTLVNCGNPRNGTSPDAGTIRNELALTHSRRSHRVRHPILRRGGRTAAGCAKTNGFGFIRSRMFPMKARRNANCQRKGFSTDGTCRGPARDDRLHSGSLARRRRPGSAFGRGPPCARSLLPAPSASRQRIHATHADARLERGDILGPRTNAS